MNSALSEFIRNASDEEKERVYGRVLERASERQNKIRRFDIKPKSGTDGPTGVIWMRASALDPVSPGSDP